NRSNENQPMEYKLVDATSEGKKIEDKDKSIESSRNFKDVNESNIPIELFVGQCFNS
ncbi:12826_t:CDS:2, partial [Gigaspora margarita]